MKDGADRTSSSSRKSSESRRLHQSWDVPSTRGDGLDNDSLAPDAVWIAAPDALPSPLRTSVDCNPGCASITTTYRSTVVVMAAHPGLQSTLRLGRGYDNDGFPSVSWTKSEGWTSVCWNRRSTTLGCEIASAVDPKHQVWEIDGANEGKHFETPSKCHTLSALPLMTVFGVVKSRRRKTKTNETGECNFPRGYRDSYN